MTMEEVTFRPYDTANYLRDDEDIALAVALGNVARARNMSQLLRDTGISREGLSQS